VEFWKFLRNYEKQLIARPNDEGIGHLLFFSSMLRNYIRYKWEVDVFTKRAIAEKAHLQGSIGNAVESTLSNCLFGIKNSCWVNALGQAVITGATAGIGAGIYNALTDKLFWAGL
jgi:hypothetical protein